MRHTFYYHGAAHFSLRCLRHYGSILGDAFAEHERRRAAEQRVKPPPLSH
jgi:hypothetical protein